MKSVTREVKQGPQAHMLGNNGEYKPKTGPTPETQSPAIAWKRAANVDLEHLTVEIHTGTCRR